MKDIPDYVSADRMIEVTVELPDGQRETFNSGFDYIVFIDIREDGVWIRNESNTNLFYPSSQILELKMSSSGDPIPEHLQKQRRQ